MGNRKQKIRQILNICIAIVVPAAWLMMAFGGEGTLSENGLGNLKYFTVLSNIMEGIASVVWLLCSGARQDKHDSAERFKYIAATSVFLTFTTVVAFLGPLYGYNTMFNGANLFFHLLVPVAAVAEIVLLTDYRFTLKDNNLAILPSLIYGIVYIVNIMINGVGEWPDTNDWYLFLSWGYKIGAVIFLSMTIVTWLLAFLMRKFQMKTNKE